MDFSKFLPFSSLFSVSLTLAVIAVVACVYLLNGEKAKLPPGPRGLPILGSLLDLGSNPHQSLHALSKRYGSLMYLKLGTTPALIASSQEAAVAILKTFDSDFSNRPENMGAVADILLYNRNDVATSPQWPVLRKICIFHLLTPKCMQKWQQFREEEMTLVLAFIFKRRTSAVNVGDFVNVFTSNVIGQMTLRLRFFDDNNAEAQHFRELMEEFLAEGGRFRIGDYVSFLDWIWLGGSLDQTKRLQKRLDEFLVRKMEEQQKRLLLSRDDNGSKDFLQILYELKSKSSEEGAELSETNIKGILLVRTLTY
ncbi:hypothetical protein SUGI_0387440 [Cryptomeria japonica]|nr:hypothetical protein SUGI_0387440 [Cryptomeria japonica]